MKNSIFFRRVGLILAALFVVGFVFTGCKPDTPVQTLPDGIEELSSSDKLVGTWKASESEIYEITTTTFKSGYEGNNLVVGYTNDEKTEGYIYVKYTKVLGETVYEEPTEDIDSWVKGEYEGFTWWTQLLTTGPDIGKWYAISFKNLEDNKLQISGAYGAKSSCDTLEEAITEFTIENKYFGTYSDCTK